VWNTKLNENLSSASWMNIGKAASTKRCGAAQVVEAAVDQRDQPDVAAGVELPGQAQAAGDRPKL
jgi:hypothetical protein